MTGTPQTQRQDVARTATTLFTQALQSFSTGRLDAAASDLQALLDLQPGHLEALELSAILAVQLDRPEAAVGYFEQLVRLKPDAAEAQFNLGNLCRRLGRLDDAETAYRAVLRMNPGVPQAIFGLGLVMAETRRLDEAEGAFRQAIALAPDYAEAFYNLGVTLVATGRPAEAEAAYRQALNLTPRFPLASNNLGCLLRDAGRFTEAEAAFRDAAEGQQIDALHNLGCLLRDVGRSEEAESAFAELVRIAPDSHLAHNSVGVLRVKEGRFAEAETAFVSALRAKPDFAEARFNLSLIQLARGDFENGWAGYEYRWTSALKKFHRAFPQPLWRGETFAGRTLLLHCEQGAGDSLQFIRYLPWVLARGGRVVLECPASLYRLFKVLPGVAAVIQTGEPLPDFDLHCPLMSLPLAFDTRVDSIPAGVPYLVPPPEAVAAAPRIAALPHAPLKVGVVWAGNPGHLNDGNRSIPFEDFAPLLAVPGITWVILQKDRRPEDFPQLAERRGWFDPMPNVRDFADTAAIVQQLDLVIGVDTSVIHLAGALAKPVWMLVAASHDWRWMFELKSSPWYPTAQVFRQDSPNDWRAVIERVAACLMEVASRARNI